MKKNRKKKGFTLIELVIVLAVLAIIALIAIPNFTKVRNDSLVKADQQTIEQIKDITMMAIANGDIAVPTSGTKNYRIDDAGLTGESETASGGFGQMLKEVKRPQVNGKAAFGITVYEDSNIVVTYTT